MKTNKKSRPEEGRSDTVEIPWPGWRLIRRIGTGGFGSVYEIERTEYGSSEKAALKIITIPKSSAEVEADFSNGYDEDGIRQKYRLELNSILKEYNLMSKLHGHSNLVSCEDVYVYEYPDKIQWDVFIRMELLTPMLKSGIVFKEPEVIKLGIDICKALIVCESHNIIHRDIKPQNIFYSNYGDYKLGDFGIAKTMDRATQLTIIGTPNYMAPEVKHHNRYGKEVDIYSLGIVLYELMNQRKLPLLPFSDRPPTEKEVRSANERRFSGEVLPPPIDASPELSYVILKACSYDPSKRYHTAKEFLDDLEKVSTGRFAIPDPYVSEGNGTELIDDGTPLIDQGKTQKLPKGPENPTPVPDPTPPKRSWLFICIAMLSALLCLALIIGGILYNNVYIPTQRYNEAVALKDVGDYEAAITEFSKLKGFKDSKDQIALCNDLLSVENHDEEQYELALQKMESGDYEDAIDLFKQIIDYKESKALIDTCEDKINATYNVEVDGEILGEFKMNEPVEVCAEPEYISVDYSFGRNFTGWTIDSGDPIIDDLSSNTISFLMPEGNVSLASNYTHWDAKPIELIVKNGFGSTTCFSGETITIRADVKEGYEFSSWKLNSGTAYIENETSQETSISFERGDSGTIEIEALLEKISQSEYQLSVQSGSGSGSYYKGVSVTVIAEKSDQGKTFAGWSVNKGNIGTVDLASEKITFSMPDEDVEITATYYVNAYSVNVLHGGGDGNYHVGDIVVISADFPSDGYVFDKWKVEQGSVSLNNVYSSGTSFVMPSDNVTIVAEYVKEVEPEPEPVVPVTESYSVISSTPQAEYNCWYWVSNDYKKGIALRPTPSQEYDPYVRLPYGTEVYATASIDEWVQVTYGGYTGWMSTTCLTKK